MQREHSTKICGFVHMRYISGTCFDSWFLKRVSQGERYSAVWCMCAPKVSTEKKDWVLKFQVLSALYLLSCWLVVFIDMNTYILIESRFSKTFLEENYPIAFSSCYLFTKKILNMELSMILIVLMELTCIRSKPSSWALQQNRWISCNLSM